MYVNILSFPPVAENIHRSSSQEGTGEGEECVKIGDYTEAGPRLRRKGDGYVMRNRHVKLLFLLLSFCAAMS
jgi:hypothetical protein